MSHRNSLRLKRRYPHLKRCVKGFWSAAGMVLVLDLFSAVDVVANAGGAPFQLGGTPFSSGAILVASAIYSSWRVTSFHPAMNKSYYQWLRQLPWTPANTLPLGQIHFVFPDWIFMAAFTSIVWMHNDLHPLWVPSVMFASFAVANILPLMATRNLTEAYALAVLAGALVYGWQNVYIAFAIALALYVVARISLVRNLADIDRWESDYLVTRMKQANFKLEARRQGLTEDEVAEMNELEGHYAFFTPAVQKEIEDRTISPRGGFYVASLLGWYYCLVSQFFLKEVFASLVFLGLILTAMRIARYASQFRAPHSLRGRLLSGHLLIRGYDSLYLPPLAGCLILLLAWLASLGRVPVFLVSLLGPNAPALLASLLTTAGTWVLLAGPPSISRWILTGAHNHIPEQSDDDEGEFVQCD